MCGLVSVISPTVQTAAQNKVLKDMLVMDQLRGKDSTGLFAVNMKGECSLYKSIANPAEFLQLPRVTSMIGSARILVGHNRHATIGAVNSNNAHPFTHNNITLVHNGTLDKWPKLPHQDDFETDSEAVCYNLSLCSNDEETVAFLETLEGAFAFIWYDDVDDALYYIRNEERELYRTKVGESTLLSSERGILFAALDRNNVTVKDLDVLDLVPVGVLHKVSTEAGKLVTETKEVTLKKRYDTYVGRGWQGKGNTKDHGYVGRCDLFDELGIYPNSVLNAVVVKSDPYQNSTSGTVTVRLRDNGHNSLGVCYGGLDVKKFVVGAAVKVRVQGMNLYHFQNQQAKLTSDFTVRCDDLVLKTSAELVAVETGTSDDVDLSDLVVCSNCDQVCHKSLTAELTDGSHICDACVETDPMIQMYIANKTA